MIKKILVGFLVLSLNLTFLKVKASSGIRNTGHSDVIELGFVDEHLGYEVLNQMSEEELNQAYKKVKRKAFGWNTTTINYAVPIWYISDVVFSKSNNTNQTFEFTYNTKYSTTAELELSASGTIATKVSGKIKAISASVNLDVEGEVTKVTKDYYEEKTNFTVVLNPKHKISLLVRGDAFLSTGVGKYFLFGISMKKGTWEYIDFVTEYYEILEEEL